MAWPYDHDRVGHPIRAKDPADPSTTSTAWDVMSKRWLMLDTVLAGTEAMRAAGQTYMPPHNAEGPINYQSRLNRATLTNFLELTLDHLTGKPFAEKIKVLEDTPEEIKALFEDVDLEGTELDTFCKAWFRAGVHKGFCHVLVDFPKLEEPPPGQVRTLADDRAAKARPYFVMIPPENLINASSEMINGREVLTRAIVRNREIVQNGFAEKIVDRVNVYTPGHVDIYQLADKRNVTAKNKWVFLSGYDTTLKFIPLVTFYAKREGLMQCKPPLLDLAFLNVAHWQSSSDQRTILTVTRFPMLAVSGASEEEAIVVVGPNQILMTTDTNGKFYYVEHTGAAIDAGANDLKELEGWMTAYGAEFLKEQPDRNTATSRSLDSAESLSPLGSMITMFVGAVATALGYMAQWMNLGENGGHIEIDKAFDLDETTQWEVMALQAARASRDISREAYLNELMRRRILNQDYDIAGDVDQIEQETSQGLGPPTGGDLNPLDNAKKGALEASAEAALNPPTPANGTAKKPGSPASQTPKPKGRTAASKAKSGQKP